MQDGHKIDNLYVVVKCEKHRISEVGPQIAFRRNEDNLHNQ